MYQIQLNYCRRAGLEPDIRIITEKMNVLTMLISVGEGVALLPEFSDQRKCNEGLAQIPIQDISCFRTIYLQTNRNVYQTELAKKFEQFCIQYFK